MASPDKTPPRGVTFPRYTRIFSREAGIGRVGLARGGCLTGRWSRWGRGRRVGVNLLAELQREAVIGLGRLPRRGRLTERGALTGCGWLAGVTFATELQRLHDELARTEDPCGDRRLLGLKDTRGLAVGESRHVDCDERQAVAFGKPGDRGEDLARLQGLLGPGSCAGIDGLNLLRAPSRSCEDAGRRCGAV